MMADLPEAALVQDEWSRWLLGRSGDDRIFEQRLADHLQKMCDSVLDRARLRPTMTLLDVGTGDGLVALSAIARMGPAFKVIVSDISRPMLSYVERIARERGVVEQCQFCECSAETLSSLADRSVDAVATRASLAFVRDKFAAFNAFHRVLQRGGRISLCEPILQDNAFETMALGELIRATPRHPDIDILRLDYRLRCQRYPSDPAAIATNPLTNFSERDLLTMAEAAGFIEIRLDLQIEIGPALITSWDVFLKTSPHPWCASNGQIMLELFTEQERSFYERVKRPLMESGTAKAKDAFAYLTAVKP